jgi:glucose/arabinose dehydrogenase
VASLALPAAATAATVGNPLCPGEEVLFNPDHGQDIVVSQGFTVSVFASGLNFPTGIAFRGNAHRFEVYVLESGRFPTSRCNDGVAWQSKGLPGNPFTPDIRVFDKSAKLLRTIGKPADASTETPGAFSPNSVVDIAFEHGSAGGRPFATDNASDGGRIATVDPDTGKVVPLITGLTPTGQLALRGGWIYWGAGATTNNGVVDSGGGQPDIPCQDITLSQNVFDSGGGILTSGYSPFGHTNKGGTVPAFFNGTTGKVRQGVCNGAVLRAQLGNPSAIEPFSWGYRNGYAIRFAPEDHPLAGSLLVGEDGSDEMGSRPSNNAPEELHLARQNPDGSPDYHGWPDRFGFLPSNQAVFNPVGGPLDALCVPDPSNPPSLCTAASLARILAEDAPIRDVLAFPPQQITSPLAIEAADSSFTAIDFAPSSFVRQPVQPGAALYTLEGDFGFNAANATPPAPEAGHEVKLMNFGPQPGDSDDDQRGGGKALVLNFQRFAYNKTFEQAFVSGIAGFNRPTNVRFGPDGCAYVADYGAIRDVGQSDPDTKYKVAADGILVQIPGTGVIWKICPQ